MADVLGRVARPWHIVDGVADRVNQWHAHRVHCGNPVGVIVDLTQSVVSHARHDAHVQHRVGRVGQLDAHLRDWATERAHRKGDNVHRATTHASVKQFSQFVNHLVGVAPVVRGTSVRFIDRADEGSVFNSSDIVGVTAHQKTVGAQLRIQLSHHALVDELAREFVPLSLAAVAPSNVGRLRQLDDVAQPVQQSSVGHHFGCVKVNCGFHVVSRGSASLRWNASKWIRKRIIDCLSENAT